MIRRHPTDDERVRALRGFASLKGNGCYLGAAGSSPVFSPPEHCALVLGPPRSGKTSGIVVPNVLAARGTAVISTKRDVLDATVALRGRLGHCLVFDPSGTLEPPAGTHSVGWSPLRAARRWSAAVAVAEAMVGAARPQNSSGESAHWTERACALIAPLLHSAALEGAAMAEVVGWINRRESERALKVLKAANAELAHDLLTGVTETDHRELSGIWSTASSVLSAYRTAESLESAERPPIELAGLLEGNDTLYVIASSENQRHCAPLVAGLVRELRAAAYARHNAGNGSGAPLLLVLDELANIAPLHDLPELISEGGSQGLVTLACLQDLSQARQRWGVAAEGFLSLFGATVVLGGLGDLHTLEAISVLAGDHDARTRSTTRSRFGIRTSETSATRRQRLLPPNAVAALPRGNGVLVQSGRVRRIAVPAYLGATPPGRAAHLHASR
jgi:type IV secretory pathway TraG/TraD family ATPase VirD4